MQKLYIILGFCTLIGLSGCGGTDTQSIEFGDKFTMDMPIYFEQTNPANITNIQIVNKIISAYRNKKEDGFWENLIISRTQIKTNISSQDFGRINIKALQKDLPGYISNSSGQLNFDCGNEQIQGIYNSFGYTQDLLGGGDSQYFMLQYYFKYGNYGYVISYINNDQEAVSTFRQDYLDTLGCK